MYFAGESWTPAGSVWWHSERATNLHCKISLLSRTQAPVVSYPYEPLPLAHS